MLLCPRDFPGTDTGVGCHFLLQGICLIQGSNLHLLCLLHCRQILYHQATREALPKESHAQTGRFVVQLKEGWSVWRWRGLQVFWVPGEENRSSHGPSCHVAWALTVLETWKVWSTTFINFFSPPRKKPRNFRVVLRVVQNHHLKKKKKDNPRELRGIKRCACWKEYFPTSASPWSQQKENLGLCLMSERVQLEMGGEGGYLKDPKVLQLFWLISLISAMFQALCLLCGANSSGSPMSHPAHK